jgi:hypothetical protein
MDIIDLDGNVLSWKLTGHTIGINNPHHKSQYHLNARKLLQKKYPTLQILEEVTIPLRPQNTLYLDFYLPLIKLCVEVHGEQHYKFIPYFHTDKIGFLKQLGRDKDKEEWCKINNIQIIILKYNEIDDWENQL